MIVLWRLRHASALRSDEVAALITRTARQSQASRESGKTHIACVDAAERDPNQAEWRRRADVERR